MDCLVVNGGKPLSGSITVGGMKNAALPILFATILVEGRCVIENLPPISDVTTALEILRAMGAKIHMLNKTTMEIDTSVIRCGSAPYELARNMRASYYVLGAELGRFRQASAACPGGCDFGVRPIDQHVKGFESLGAKVSVVSGYVRCDASESGLKAANIYMDVVTVGATINIMLAAVKAQGQTVIENAAKEPHVVDLAHFLHACGANIVGAGTDIIKIKGVDTLHGVTYAIIPDMIEAGTYMMAAAATGSRLTVSNVIPKHLESITAKLEEMGVGIEEHDESVTVIPNGRLGRVNVKTLPYPGFPTDMNPQMCVLLCLADGMSVLTEGVWDGRFKYTEELIRMGASIKVDGRTAIVEGVESLRCAHVRAVDLRAGAAMVIAALTAPGETVISDIHHIERGYECIVEKLQSVGADIRRVTMADVGASANVS